MIEKLTSFRGLKRSAVFYPKKLSNISIVQGVINDRWIIPAAKLRIIGPSNITARKQYLPSLPKL